jgi:outer membrane protein assembly factor BamB
MLALLLVDVLIPPFHQVDSYLAGLNEYAPLKVSGATAYYRLGDHCLAFDLARFKLKWQARVPENDFRAQSIAVGKYVYVGTKGRLLALDPATGKTAWSLPAKGGAVAVASDDRTIVAQLAPNEISAIDVASHRVLWHRPLPKKAGDGTDGLDAGEINSSKGTRTLTLVGGSVLAAYDVATGKPLWTRPKTYVTEEHRTPVIGKILWVSGDGSSEGRDLRTGRIVWTNPDAGSSDFAGTFDGNFVGIGHGRVFALSAQNGHLLWSHEIGPRNTTGGNQYGAVLTQRLFVRGISQGMAVNVNGKLLWQQPAETMIGQPLWTDGRAFVTDDAGRFVRYLPGADAALPTSAEGRRREAARLVARFDKLDAAGIKRLQALGNDAFVPLFAEFLRVCRAHDAEKGGDSYPLYSEFHDLAKVLDGIVTEERVPELIAAMNAAKSEGSEKPFVMGWLAKFGNPDAVVPLFLKELGAKTPGFEMYESNSYVARNYIVRSTHPLAVRFMIDQLENPAADPVLRQEAYWRLAGTGGEEGRRVVLKYRHHRELLKPLDQRMDLGHVGKSERDAKITTLVAERADPNSGRTWALLKCGILGSHGDLWLAEKVNGAYRNPLFTGVTLDGISRWNKSGLPEPKIGGKTAKELATGAWFNVLVNNSALSRDSDRDGLTDIVEARLGTDPTKADTDGDGDRDEIDPWPNVAASPETDAQRVLAAAFEARYWGDTYPGTALMSEKFTPFEMPGRRGPVLFDADHSDFSGTLSRHYEQGIAMIGISTPDKGSDPEGREAIVWNRDRTEATVRISTYYGGLNGTGYVAVVRKFGDEWFVVSMDMEFIS